MIIAFLLLFVAPAWATNGTMALVQYNADLHFGDLSYNRAALTALKDEAVSHGANIVVFPEGSLYGYAGQGQLWCRDVSQAHGCVSVSSVAEMVPGGPSTVYWSDHAQRSGLYILFNIPEKSGSSFFNTTVVVGPMGYIGKYRKRMLYETDEYYAQPGQEAFVLQTPYGDFGILICMDATYQGLLENYHRAGLDSVILMMDWDQSPTGSNAAFSFFRERARAAHVSIYASDVSAWDGTGFYPATGAPRIRTGLVEPGVHVDGISYHSIGHE